MKSQEMVEQSIPAGAKARKSGPAHILVVDDEPPIRAMLCAMLERLGHRVSEAEDGCQGIAAYRKLQPDLMLVDILMPGKGGLSVIKEVLVHEHDARIIAISGGGTSGKLNYLSTARTFPGVSTLAKPFTFLELQTAVTRALAAR